MGKSPLIAKRQKPDTVERDIVVGMIVSDRFLSRFRPYWKSEWHTSDICRVVAQWCTEYFDSYKKAPGKDIEKKFQDWADDLDGPETDLIEQMLSLASQEHERQEQFNDQYLLDRAENWARAQVVRELTDDLDGALGEGDIDDAASRLEGLELPRFGGKRDYADPADKESLKRAFERTYVPLFKMPGALGQMLNGQLYREGFIAFMAPEKRGKTALLMELAYWAARGHCNVAYFSIGDMSDDQLRLRWASRLTGLPDDKQFAGEQERAVGIDMEGGEANIIWETENVPVLTWKTAYKAIKRFESRWGAGRIRFQSWPNFTCGVPDLERELDAWENEGWVADFTVVDYADNLIVQNRDDYRHRINLVWQGLRKISQERRNLLATATQTDADSYKRGSIGLNNFSEDKRKFAHITAMGAINQDESERTLGITRLAWLLLRRGRALGQVALLGDLSRGKMLVKPNASWWWKNGGKDK